MAQTRRLRLERPNDIFPASSTPMGEDRERTPDEKKTLRKGFDGA